MTTEKNKTKLMELTYDFMFKAVFGNETNMKALTGLICDYFKIDINEIKGKVRIMNSELIKNDKNDKKKCVDIIVEINDEEILNIEMNANRGNERLTTIERNTAYICKIFSEQYRSGDKYNKTKKCVQINFNNFGIDGENNGKAVFMLRNKNGENELTKNLEIHYLNMEHMASVCYNEFTDSEIVKWILLIKSKTMEELKMRSEFMDDDMRETFISEVERLSSDEHIIGLYNAEIEDEIMKNAIREHSKEEGYKEGVEQGIEQKQREIIINMLNEKLDVNLISKYTGVDVEEVGKIKDEN